MVELLIIIAIIGLLASIIMVAWAASSQNKAARNSYQTVMQSVRTAAEMCIISNGDIQSGKQEGNSICLPSVGAKYPAFPSRCGDSPYFCVGADGAGNWHISTFSDNSCTTPWECRGCRLDCSTAGCEKNGTCD